MRTKKNVDVWYPLKIKYDTVLVSGGNHNGFLATEVRKVGVGAEEKTFLKISHKEPWLVAGAAGSRHVSEGMTRRTSLVDELKRKLEMACDGCPTAAVTANLDRNDALSDDDDLFPDTSAPRVSIAGTRGRGQKRNRFFHNHCKYKVIHIEMSAIAPEKDPTCKAKRIVSLYCEDRRHLWLNVNDAEWAMEYLYHQLKSKGVPAVADNDPGPGGSHPPPLLPHQPLLGLTNAGVSLEK